MSTQSSVRIKCCYSESITFQLQLWTDTHRTQQSREGDDQTLDPFRLHLFKKIKLKDLCYIHFQTLCQCKACNRQHRDTPHVYHIRSSKKTPSYLALFTAFPQKCSVLEKNDALLYFRSEADKPGPSEKSSKLEK